MADLVAGTILGETYELVAPIGRGGMGTVWSAQHLRLPRRVAIKVLHKVPDADSIPFARFRREAEIASRLNHPNIVEVLDFNVHDNGVPYFVMPLLDGISLSARIAAGPVSIDEAQRWIRQIGSALDAAHACGVIHRDLKPANVFLCQTEVDGQPAEQLKVLDFGTSKILGSTSVQTAQATMIGTPQYMAPEQARGDNPAIGPHTDQFALAALAYELLLGEPPFGTGHPAAIVYRIMHEAEKPLTGHVPGLGEDIASAVHRGLAKDPDERFETLPGFVAAFCRDEPPAARIQLSLDATIEAPAPDTIPPPTNITDEAPPQRWAPAAAIAVLAIAAIALIPLLGEDDATPATAPTTTPTPGVTAPAPEPPTRAEEAASRTAARGLEARATAPATRRDPTAVSATPRRAPEAHRTPKSRPGPSTPKARPTPSLPKATGPALADANAAASALRSGNARKAMYLARRSLREARNGPALEVIAKAYCLANDIGSAQAALRAVPGARRGAVRHYCKSRGLDL